MKLIKEFWPALKFLLTFIGVYFACNVIYGAYIEFVQPTPDLFTRAIAEQTSWILYLFNEPVSTQMNKGGSTVFLNRESNAVLNIYEGCNGVNVFIVFVAFLLAFPGHTKTKIAFLAIGCCLINISNVIRIVLLYFVSLHYQTYFYFIHKYIFTIVLYAIVVIMWMAFVKRLSPNAKTEKSAG
jgi:exosortase family protein XrtF